MITVNNPNIWRPVYDLRDCVEAYVRAIQADESVSGVFNVCSGDFTVGAVADLVKDEVETLSGRQIKIEVKNIPDFRNYRVSIDKARAELGFDPQFSIKDMVADLYAHREQYGDFDKDEYYNIRVFKKLEADSSK
jgi:nucleoside-diphosphate-sugar epimerase